MAKIFSTILATITCISLTQFAFGGETAVHGSTGNEANAELSIECRTTAEYWGGRIQEALKLYRHQDMSALSYMAIRQIANRNAVISAQKCQLPTATEISTDAMKRRGSDDLRLIQASMVSGTYVNGMDSTAEFLGVFERAKAGLLTQENYLDTGTRDRRFLESWLHDRLMDVAWESGLVGRPSEKQRGLIDSRLTALNQSLATRWANLQLRGSTLIGSGYASVNTGSASRQLLEEYLQICGEVFESTTCHGVERDQ